MVSPGPRAVSLPPLLLTSCIASGIGIHYAPSAITNSKYQDAAKNLIIGQRIIPQVVVRAADGRSYDVQDLLPSDVRFKVLVFAGDTSRVCQYGRLQRLSSDLETLLKKYSRTQKLEGLFDVLSIRYDIGFGLVSW